VPVGGVAGGVEGVKNTLAFGSERRPGRGKRGEAESGDSSGNSSGNSSGDGSKTAGADGARKRPRRERKPSRPLPPL